MAAAALLTAACGSTVPVAQRPGSGQGELAGSGQAGSTLSAGSDVGSEALDGSGTVTGGQSRSTGGSTTRAATSGGGASLPNIGGIPARGRGWDEKYAYIGVPTLNDLSTFGNAAGYRSVETGDVEADALAIVADINAKGGLFGRQLRIFFKDTSTANIISNTEASVQAVCTEFTQDHPVIAVVTVFGNFDTDTMRGCLAKADTMLLSSSPGASSTDDEVYAKSAPYYHTFATLSYNRFAPVLARRLAAQHFFTGWDTTLGGPATAVPVKLGLVFKDSVIERRIAQGVERDFKAAGHPIAVTVPVGASPSDNSTAVLTFKSANVTHIIVMLPAADAVVLNFLVNAESQRYRPRYALSTPQFLGFHADNAPHAQLVGSLGIGWLPGLDVDEQQDPGDVGGGQAACRAALAKGGQTFSGDHRFALALALGMCDGIHMVAEGARAGKSLTATATRAGLVSIGGRFSAAATFSPTGIHATSYGLVGGGRDVGWDTTCECFTYRGPTYAIAP
jgi:ABC-type branched-subunit amino acid transport system substrate-binding protein